MIAFICMVIIILGMVSWTNQRFILGFVIFFGMPISMIFTVGSLKNRLVNGLSIVSIYLYLILSLRFGWWDEAGIILLFTPYVSLIIKPKRNILKYVVTIFSTIFLVYGIWTGNPVHFLIKWGIIFILYALFLPPILISIFHKNVDRVKSKLKLTKKKES